MAFIKAATPRLVKHTMEYIAEKGAENKNENKNGYIKDHVVLLFDRLELLD